MLSKRNNSCVCVRIEVTQWWFPVWWIWTAGPCFSVKLLFETHLLSVVLYAGALHGVWKPLMSVNCFDKMLCTSSRISDVNHCLPAMMFLSFGVRLPTQGDVSLSMCPCIFGAENSSFIFLGGNVSGVCVLTSSAGLLLPGIKGQWRSGRSGKSSLHDDLSSCIVSRLKWSFFFDIGVFLLVLCTSFLSVFLVLRMDDGVFGVCDKCGIWRRFYDRLIVVWSRLLLIWFLVNSFACFF